MGRKSVETALKDAIDMERKGYQFYNMISKRALNKVTKKTFGSMADYEMLHIESIKNFYNAKRNKGEFPAFSIGRPVKKRINERRIFSRTINELRGKVSPSDDDKRACEFAMEFENEGYRFYRDMLRKAKDKNLRKLLNFLLEEESGHFETFKKLHEYLADTANWYMYEEGSFPQGG